jgi:hypothetical protein
MSVPPPPPRRTQPAAPGPAGGQTGAQAPRRTQVVAQPSPTRAQRQAQSQPPGRSGGRRWGLVAALAVLGVVVVAAAAFFVLKSGSNEKSAPVFKASTAVDLQPGEATVAAVENPIEFPTDARDAALATLGNYVETGIVAPLRKGTVDDAALATVFDEAAIARLVGAERAIVLDEGLPKAVGKVTVTTPPVPLTALADRDGKVVLVTVGVQFAVKARAENGVIQINRTGSFVLAPDATGTWKITGWTLTTDRGGPGVAPASTPASDTTPTTVNP